MGVGRADRRNRVFSYGIALGLPHRRQGYGTEAVVLLLRFYFAELNYQKCDTTVYAFNESSLAFHERLGFQVEGTCRRNIFTRGRYHDVVLVAMTREEFDAHHGLEPAD
jgi:RimJ/RimL family protein N-acetyltransferase